MAIYSPVKHKKIIKKYLCTMEKPTDQLSDRIGQRASVLSFDVTRQQLITVINHFILSSVVHSTRLLHSLRLVSVGLSVGYETLYMVSNRLTPPIVTGWSKYSSEMPKSQCLLGSGRNAIPIVFQRTLTVPLHIPNGRQMHAAGAMQGDC